MSKPFKGQVWDRGSAHHVFYVEGNKTYDKLLLTEFNLFSYEENYIGNKAVQDMWNQTYSEPKTVADLPFYVPAAPEGRRAEFINAPFFGQRWNGSSYEDFSMGQLDILNVVTYWEAKCTGAFKDGSPFVENSTRESQLQDCLQCQNLELISTGADGGKIHVYFIEPQAKKPSNARSVTSKGRPVIVAVPRTSTGKKWSRKKTEDNKSGDTVGGVSNPDTDDENNPDDQVAGELNVSYNENTGMWEPQTQVLARLITTLDSANMSAIDLSEGTYDNGDFYNTSSPVYQGNFTTAQAIPLSMHDGNPATYGPRLYSCENNVVEKIMVVNRSNRSFDVGTVGMCHKVDGEWLFTDMGTDQPPVPLPPEIDNKWQFSKFFASSDIHFKNRDDTQNITPDQVEQHFRDMCWYSIGTSPSIYDENMVNIPEYALLNRYPTVVWENIQDLDNGEPVLQFHQLYLQSIISDQLGPEMAGNSSISYLQRTNLYHPVTGQNEAGPGDEYFSTNGLMWGPMFPEGYRSTHYYSQAGKPGSFTTHGVFGDSAFTGGATVSEAFNNVANSYSDAPVRGMFSNENDTNLKQLPAEIAVHGSGNPIEMYTRKNNLLYAGDTPFLDSLAEYSELTHQVWLGDGDNRSAFEFEPIDKTTICFVPLTDNFACSADMYSQYTTDDRDYHFDTMEYLKGVFREGQGMVDVNIYGNMFDPMRFGTGALEYYTTDSIPDCQAVYKIPDGTQPQQSFVQVQYDVYCRKPATSKPINTVVQPFYHDDACANGNGGNLLGIITARNTFTKVGGGQLVFELDQSFGYQGERILSTSSNVYITGLLGMFTGSTSSPSALDAQIASWGSTDNDDIDSFGTTALHVKVYDQWPREDTIFFDPYFAVCHKNPGTYNHQPEYDVIYIKVDPDTGLYNWSAGDQSDQYGTEEELQQAAFDGEIIAWNQDKIGSTVDMRVPTDFLGNAIAPGTVIDYSSRNMPTEEYWNVATFRRGVAISTGGLRYWKNVIGLGSYEIREGEEGSGFVNNEEVDGPGGSRWRIKTNSEGGIDTIEVIQTTGDENNGYVSNTEAGQGFMPEDFDEQDGYVWRVTSPSSSNSATIRFVEGVVYKRMFAQNYPQQRVGKTRLSTGSGDGKVKIYGSVQSSVDLGPQNDSGSYEAFFYFHNDISHNIFFEVQTTQGLQPPYQQYITMSIK